MRVLRPAARGALVGASAVLALAGPVSAAWVQTPTATSTFGAATLAAPTGLGASRSCLLGVQTITLSWTPSASTWATGYAVWRKSGAGSFTQVATVPGRLSTGYVDTPLALSTTYTYYVSTTFSSWTAASAQASATTLNILCL